MFHFHILLSKNTCDIIFAACKYNRCRKRKGDKPRHFAISIVATLGNIIIRHALAERPLISPIEISCRVSKNTFTQSHTRAGE